MPKYRHRPLEVEAIELRSYNLKFDSSTGAWEPAAYHSWPDWAQEAICLRGGDASHPVLDVRLSQGVYKSIKPGQFLVRDYERNIHVCTPERFAVLYELAEKPAERR